MIIKDLETLFKEKSNFPFLIWVIKEEIGFKLVDKKYSRNDEYYPSIWLSEKSKIIYDSVALSEQLIVLLNRKTSEINYDIIYNVTRKEWYI